MFVDVCWSCPSISGVVQHGALRKSYVIGSFFKLQEAKKESAREVEQLLNQADIVCSLVDIFIWKKLCCEKATL